MARSKKLIALVVFMIVLIAAYFLISDWAEDEIFEPVEYSYMTTYTADQVVSLEWDYNGAVYHVDKVDGTWVAAGSESLELDQEELESLAKVISQITCTSTITDVDDYEQYGLDSYTASIRAGLEDGSVYEIITGDYNKVAKQYYAMIGGKPEVYLTDAYYIDNFECTVEDLVFVEETETSDSAEA